MRLYSVACHLIVQVMGHSGAKFSVWVFQAIVYSSLEGTELAPITCSYLCNERLVCSAFQNFVVLQLLVVVDGSALVMFDRGSVMFLRISCLAAL